MVYYVYILQCQDGSYYTGYTSNVSKRLQQHQEGKGSRYTRTRRPVRLIHTEAYGSRTDAMRREREIKKMGRREKELLFRRRLKRN